MAGHKTSARPPRILAFTNSDRGEANVFLATFQAILHVDPSAELHLATFGSLRDPVASIAENVRAAGWPEARPVTFHLIDGMPMDDGLRQYFRTRDTARKDDYLPESFLTPLDFSTSKRAIRDAVPIFVPYEAPELARIVASMTAIIKDVDADLVVVDTLMTAALTACYHLGVRFTCLSPNAIKEFAAPEQPHAASLWKYPA